MFYRPDKPRCEYKPHAFLNKWCVPAVNCITQLQKLEVGTALTVIPCAEVQGQIPAVFFPHVTTTGPGLSQGPENGSLNSLDFVFNIDIIIITIIITYKSPNFIVVQVNQRTGIVSCFQGIHKKFGNLLPKLHVVTASSPDPASATCKTDTGLSTDLPQILP